MKGNVMKHKVISDRGLAVLAAAAVVLSLAHPARAQKTERETIKMKLIVTNPADEEKTIAIKEYIPAEIKREVDVVSTDGLELGYDQENSMFYVYTPDDKRIVLPAKEQKIITVELEDVWHIDDKEREKLRKRAEHVLKLLRGNQFESRGKEIVGDISDRLKGIKKFQEDAAVTKREYIAGYRANMERMNQMRHDIETMESFVAKPSDPSIDNPIPTIDGAPEPPDKRTTWLIIFAILGFVGLTTAAVYFMGQNRSRSEGSLIAEGGDSSTSESSSEDS